MKRYVPWRLEACNHIRSGIARLFAEPAWP